MSLLRLLTAGKSLTGLKQLPGRYKISDPRSMPKFRSTVNPFKSKTAKTEPEPQPKAASAVKEAAVAAPVGQPEPPSVSVEVAEPAAPESVEQPEPAERLVRGRRGGWISKLSSLKVVLQLLRAGTRKSPRVAPAVQGELSLDNIKVI